MSESLDWLELKSVLVVLVRDRPGGWRISRPSTPAPLHPCTATQFLPAANKADDDGPPAALGE